MAGLRQRGLVHTVEVVVVLQEVQWEAPRLEFGKYSRDLVNQTRSLNLGFDGESPRGLANQKDQPVSIQGLVIVK